MNLLVSTLAIGVVATAVIDLWSVLRWRLFGVAKPNYALVWRWLVGVAQGSWVQTAIKQSPKVPGEQWLGWCAHYGIGVGFAAVLVIWQGQGWLNQPTLWPAILVGAITVLAPFCLMQPGMGLGFAAAKTPEPNRARLHSLVTHLLFGLGLYIGAVLLKRITA